MGLAAIVLGAAALPAAIGASVNLLAVALAGIGLLFGLFAIGASAMRRGAGIGVAAIGVVVCGASLASGVVIFGGVGGLLQPPPDRRADAGNAGPDDRKHDGHETDQEKAKPPDSEGPPKDETAPAPEAPLPPPMKPPTADDPPATATEGTAPPAGVVILTEDQRIAWNKLRRKHNEPSCYIVGYVTTERDFGRDVTGPWRMYGPNYQDPSSPNWYGGLGTIYHDYTPRNEALDKARNDEAACKQNIETVQSYLDGKIRPPSDGLGIPLIEDLQDRSAERAKERKKELADLARLQQELADAKDREEAAKKNPPRTEPAASCATPDAQSLSTHPNVKATAVADLFGGPDPKVLKWFIDDGKGPKELKVAPTPELDASLRAYLHDLQTRADRLGTAGAAPSNNDLKAFFDNGFNNPLAPGPLAPLPEAGGPKLPTAGGP